MSDWWVRCRLLQLKEKTIVQLIRQISGLIRDVAWASRSTDGPSSFFRLSADFILGRAMKWVGVPGKGRERFIRLSDGTVLTYRLDRADLWVIHEIWVCEMYRPLITNSPAVVIDVGANIGMASLWFVKRMGASRVIALEPSSANARIARLNFERNKIEGEVLEVAAGPTDGQAMFLEHHSSTCGRLDSQGAASDRTESRGPSRRAVEMRSMKTVLDRLPELAEADLVKIDIEGGEGPLLEGDVTWLSRVSALVVEFHPSLVDYPALLRVFDDAGFVRSAGSPVAGQPIDFFVRRKEAPADQKWQRR